MIAPDMNPPMRMRRLRALLPQASAHHDTMRSAELPSQMKADATRDYVNAVDEIVAHLLVLEELGVLSDAQDMVDFTYGGKA